MLHEPKSFRPAALAMAAALAGIADPALAETTFSVYVGNSHTANSDVHITQPSSNSDATFHEVGWASESFSNPIYYGLRLNHFFEAQRNWGLGLDYTHDKVSANVGQNVNANGTWNGAPIHDNLPMNLRVQSFAISHGVNIVALNVYYRWLHESQESVICIGCEPYVGAGLTYYVLHAENTVNGQNNSEGYKGTGPGYQLLGGFHYDFTRTLGLFVEAKYNSGDVEVDTAGGGHARTILNSMQMLAGVSLAF